MWKPERKPYVWQILIKLNLKSEKIDSYLPPIPLEKQQITKLKKKTKQEKQKQKKTTTFKTTL